MAVVTVVGAGMMGSALCVPLLDAGHEVRLVGTHLDGDIVESLRAGGPHPTLKFPLPDGIRSFPIERIAEAMEGVEAIGVGVSSAGVEWASRTLAPFVRPAVPIVMISKGLTWDGERLGVLPDALTRHFQADVAARVAPVAVAGPCIAGELARRIPSAVVLTGRSRHVSEQVAALLRADYYYPFVSDDVVGVEACAALKNAYAMGIAFPTGEHEGRGGTAGSIARHNAESAIFAQALHEMAAWVAALGGQAESVMGLAGAGDLDVTTNGGRTGRFGKWLGTGLSLPAAIEKMEGATLECLEILAVLRGALPRLEEAGVLRSERLPLLSHMQAVALDGAPVDVPYTQFFRN